MILKWTVYLFGKNAKINPATKWYAILINFYMSLMIHVIV